MASWPDRASGAEVVVTAGAAPGPTTEPAATPSTGQGASAGAAVDSGAPIAGATPAAQPGG